MKKLLIIYVLIIALGLMSVPAFGIQYCKDFLEPGNAGGWTDGLRTWDEVWTMIVSETIEVDIWLNDVPELLQFGGVFINVLDLSKATIVNVEPFDGIVLLGPWTTKSIVTEVLQGQIYCVVLKEDGLITPKPGGGFPNGDIIISRVTFHCEAQGDANIQISTIPYVGTIGSRTHVYDPEINPNTVTINPEDVDSDGINDYLDNCPYTPNGHDGGTCTSGNIGESCMSIGDCGIGGFCSMNQEDTYPPQGNECGGL